MRETAGDRPNTVVDNTLKDFEVVPCLEADRKKIRNRDLNILRNPCQHNDGRFLLSSHLPRNMQKRTNLQIGFVNHGIAPHLD